MPPAVARPNILTGPGFLWGAPLGTAAPTNTITGGVFTDTVPPAYVPFGATEGGSTFNYSSTVEAIEVAEFLDPIRYETTGRGGNITFNLANYTMSNVKRALNGGVGAVVPTGSAGSELSTVEPPNPGEEVRIMVLWESTDATVRILCRQAIQGGEFSSMFAKAPAYATIPCTFNFEVPTVGKPFSIWGAGANRV